MSGLSRLPPELLVKVLRVLPGCAIKSLRLTCSPLNNAASEFLFPVLYLSCHPLDLEVFQLVISNPLLVAGVRELVIDDTTLAPSLASWHNYAALAAYEGIHWPKRNEPYFIEDPPFDAPTGRRTSKPSKEAHDIFVSICEPHHRNRLAHADVLALKEAIPKLRSLRSLVLSNRTADESHYSGAQSYYSSSPTVRMWRKASMGLKERIPFPPRCDWWDAWGSPMPRTSENMWSMDWLDDELDRKIREEGPPSAATDLTIISNEPGSSERLEATRHENEESRINAANESSEREEADEEFDEDADEDGGDEEDEKEYLHYHSIRSVALEARGLLVALEALSNPSLRSQIREFRIDASHDLVDDMYQPGLSIRLFDNYAPFPDQLISTLGSAPNLRSFHLVLSNGYKYWDGQYRMEQGHVGRVLASLPGLEELVLESHGMSTIEAIPQDVTFTQLKKIEFRCGDMVPERMKDFLYRHAATLTSLRIEYCNIDPEEQSGTWADVVEDIVKLQDDGITKLQQAILHKVYAYKPFTGCGKNNTMTKGRTPDLIHCWAYGVNEKLMHHRDCDDD